MSLVGTRPPTVDEWEQYELHHRSRMSTKPGIKRKAMERLDETSNSSFNYKPSKSILAFLASL